MKLWRKFYYCFRESWNVYDHWKSLRRLNTRTQKKSRKLTSKMFYGIDSWALFYKAFHSSNLWIFVISNYSTSPSKQSCKETLEKILLLFSWKLKCLWSLKKFATIKHSNSEKESQINFKNISWDWLLGPIL